MLQRNYINKSLHKKETSDELKGLVVGLTDEVESQKVVFYKKPEFAAIISCIVLIILNILFW